jgi:M6 family metalloprotease-like protein
MDRPVFPRAGVWVAVLAGAAAIGLPGSGASGLASQAATTRGTLTAVWGDPPAGADEAPVLEWYLVDDGGRLLGVEVAPELLRRAGGVRSLDRRRVAVTGSLDGRAGAGGTRLPGPPRLRATDLRVTGPAALSSAPAPVGARPYAVVLCQFPDLPPSPRPASFLAALMGGGYPNMDHYYGEVSGGRMTLAGTGIHGWYTLPQPRELYFEDGASVLSLHRLAEDCMAAAGGAVEWSAYSGIVLQFNGGFSRSGQGLAYGGSRVLTVGGQERVWPFVWMPLWALEHSRYGIYAHELGHSLGLPHSSGPYDQTYDSSWDVMSRPYLGWDAGLQAWVPGQTIGFHKDLLGWIPADRIVTVTGGPAAELRLDPHGGDAGDGALLVRVPIPGTPDFYTVEARRRSGYDGNLPGEAVIMHRVPDPLGPGCTLHRCATVVDAYGNGNPNDAGAMWLPGETFEDGRVRVSVTGASGAGWEVVVSVAAPARPGSLTVARAAAALLGEVELTAGEVDYLDVMGNGNGRYDLGDFLAFMRRQ